MKRRRRSTPPRTHPKLTPPSERILAATISDLGEVGVIRSDLIERYSLPTDFGKRYRDRFSASKDVTAVLEARCVKLGGVPARIELRRLRSR